METIIAVDISLFILNPLYTMWVILWIKSRLSTFLCTCC